MIISNIRAREGGRVTHSCRSHGGPSVSSTLNTIGLRDIATKPAEDTLTTFIDLLEDLDEAQEDTGWPKDSVKYYNI